MTEAHPDFPARALQQEGPVGREGEKERGGEGERGERGRGGDVKGYGKVHRKHIISQNSCTVDWWCSLEVATALLAAEEIDEPMTCLPAVSHQPLHMMHPRVQVRSRRGWGRRGQGRRRKGEGGR